MSYLQYLLETTEHVISVGSIPALQLGCPRFKSQPRDKIVWQIFNDFTRLVHINAPSLPQNTIKQRLKKEIIFFYIIQLDYQQYTNIRKNYVSYCTFEMKDNHKNQPQGIQNHNKNNYAVTHKMNIPF